jgi:hypothetical protein
MKRLVLGISLLALAVLVGLPNLAHADTLNVAYSTGPALPPAAPSVVLTTSDTTGSYNSGGPIAAGAFVINSITAVGTGSGIASIPEPQLTANTINVSSAGTGSLYIYVTESNITSPVPGPNDMLSLFTALNVTPGLTVTENTFVSAANALWTGTALDTATFTSLVATGASSIDLTPVLANPYSETEEYVITSTTTGTLTTNDSIGLSLVPEPGSLSLLSSGLFGIALLGFRRRKVTA